MGLRISLQCLLPKSKDFCHAPKIRFSSIRTILHQTVRLQFWKSGDSSISSFYGLSTSVENLIPKAYSLKNKLFYLTNNSVAQSAGAVEYTDWKDPSPNECSGYDTKQSDGEVPVMLGPWWIRSTPSLPLLTGPLWPGVIAPDRALCTA